MARTARIIGLRIYTYGDPIKESALLVSNHISFLDIVVISSVLPARFLSKASVRSWPVVGYLTAVSGSLFIQRGRRAVISQVLAEITEALKQDRPVLIFPEGTTTLGDAVKKFHSGLLQSAIDAKVPIQPIAISYLLNGEIDRDAAYIDKDNFVINLLRLLSRPDSDVHVHFTDPISTSDKTRNELANKAQLTVSKIISREAHSTEYLN